VHTRWLIALGALLIGAGLGLWLPESLESASKPRTDLGAALIGGAIVAFALLLAEHMLNLGMERRSLAQSYTSRLTDPAFVDAMVKTADFFKLRDRTVDDAWEAWRALDATSKMRLLEFPNFLALLATEYCSNRVDRAIVRATFDPVAVNYWRELYWFIERFRDDHPDVYQDWETMKNEFEGARA
jgi:hypothetical protein